MLQKVFIFVYPESSVKRDGSIKAFLGDIFAHREL